MYRYAIEILRKAGERVGQRVVEPDFAPLIESARLAYLRRHGPAATAGYDRAVTIAPVWQEKLGEPYVGGFLLRVDGDTESMRAATSLMRPAAAEASREFVKSGALQDGEAFVYLVTAYLDPAEAPPAAGRAFRMRELPSGISISYGAWSGDGSDDPHALRVAVPQRVLDEIAGLTREKSGIETGGVLIGHLRWDQRGNDLFVDVTEQIHARYALGDATRLQFTPECWTEIRAALSIRGRGEAILGWWHSHPGRGWCSECPRERQETCELQKGFLSEHDKTLHRTVFPRAFMPALVATDSVLGSIQFAMFGWRQGLLEPLPYQVTGSDSGSLHQIEEGVKECVPQK